MTGSCGVSSCTVGGNLSLTETDGDIDDWDICPPEVVVLCGNKKNGGFSTRSGVQHATTQPYTYHQLQGKSFAVET